MSWKLLMVACLIATAMGPAQAADVARPDVDKQIREMMDNVGIPGVQTAVIKNGRVVWAKSYGYSVLDQPGPRRQMRNDTLMRSASVMKILVAVAVLQQVEQGRLRLDDDINGYVPLNVRNPAWPDVPITWRMLLTHISSLDNEDDERLGRTIVYGHDTTVTLEDYVKGTFTPGDPSYWDKQFRAGKPGTERIYSNNGFDLLAYALQRLVHEPFDQYVRRAILEPLGMHDTTYWLAGQRADRFAVGYATVRQKDGHFSFVPGEAYWGHRDPRAPVLEQQITCADYPSGCAHTTAVDFARLILMLMNHGTVDGVRVLSPGSVDLMTTPTGFRNPRGWTQGLGIFGPYDIRGRQVWGHYGEDRGTATAAFFNPETGIGGIAFTNAMDPDWTMSFVVVDLDLHVMSWFE